MSDMTPPAGERAIKPVIHLLRARSGDWKKHFTHCGRIITKPNRTRAFLTQGVTCKQCRGKP